MKKLIWYNNPKYFTDIESKVTLKSKLMHGEVFTTIRLGDKYLNQFNIDERISIVLADSEKEIELGEADVISLSKKYLKYLNCYDMDRNIGSKDYTDISRDMQDVYPDHGINGDTLVTVIELQGII